MNNKFTKVLPLCVAAFLALPFVTEHAYAVEKDIKVETPVSETQANVFAEGAEGNTDGTVIKDYDSASGNGLTEEQKKKIEYVKVGEKVKTIGKYALAGMEALEEVDLPKSLEQVKDHAFEGCDKLSKVTYQGTEKQWEAVEIGHEGNAPLEDAKVEALSIGIEEVDITTKAPVIGVNPENNVLSSATSNKFTVEDNWKDEITHKVKSSSAEANEKTLDINLFDTFEEDHTYSHELILKIKKDLIEKGYHFDETAFTNVKKIKYNGRIIDIASVEISENGTKATLSSISGICTVAAPVEEETSEEKKAEEKKAEEKKAEEAKKAAEAAAKTEVSNSEFYKTGDASVLPLISTMLTSGLAAFASRKKKD